MSSEAAISVFDRDADVSDSVGDQDAERQQSEPRRPWYRRPWVIGLAVLLVALVATGVWWFGFRSDGAAATSTSITQLATVTTGSMSTTVSAEGTVEAAQTDDLSFTASGTVTAVNVKAGDAVTAGQVLATADSAELESAVASAEANLASAKATLSDDRSAGASSEQIDADEANVSSAQDSLTAAQQNLDGAKLVATFAGTVSTVDVTVGEQLGSGGSGGTTPTGSGSGSGQTAANLGSSSGAFPGGDTSSQTDSASTATEPQIQVVSKGRYTVELPMDTDSVTGVEVGQSVALTVTTSSSSSGGFPGGGAFPGGGFPGGGAIPGGGGSQTAQGSGADANPSTGATATGIVTSVSAVADTSSGVARYPVNVAFDADSGDVYVGATVTGDISTDTREDVVQVSSRAVTTTNGVSTVTVATKGTLDGPTESRRVGTGLTANGMTEITSGLRAGEKVVVSIQLPTGLRAPTGGGGNQGPGGFQLPDGFQPPSGFTPPSGAGGGS